MAGINLTSGFNPTDLATQLATAYTQPAQMVVDGQNKSAQATSSALNTLRSALQTFQSALTSLSGKKGITQNSATFNQTGFATASATNAAEPGTYSIFVEQLATANQVAFNNVPSSAAPGGTLGVNLAGGGAFTVDLSAADTDGDAMVSVAELARAINSAPNNKGQANAMVVTTGGTTQLVLSAANTGAGSRITLDTTGLTSSSLASTLADANRTDLAQARDAVVWLGAQGTGLKVQQASNTFNFINGVSMTFTQAQAAGATPLNLTVAQDNSGTASNVKNFVDAYNALKKAMDGLTSTGSVKDGVAAAVFASDASIRSLQDRLHTVLRQSYGGLTLMNFGVTADRNGVLSLDQTKMQNTLATNPTGLDTLFGSTGIVSSSGLMGDMGNTLSPWLNSANGLIKQRQDSLATLQKNLANRQTQLDQQYSDAYNRYLRQFSQMQALQAQMNQNMGLFG